MKKYLMLSLLVLSGCAVSPNGVKDHNLLNAFNSDKSAHEVIEVVAAMSDYCSSGIFETVKEEHPVVGKATLSLKNKHANHYYFLVDAEDKRPGGSLVKTYHYSDTSVTNGMARAVRDWVEGSNKECVRGF